MKKIHKLQYVVILFFTCYFVSNATAFETPEKFMVEYKLNYSYTLDSIRQYCKNNNIPRFVFPSHNSVDMYEITYKGLWIDSTFIIAKGVLYVPKITKPAAEMVFCHGTQINVDVTYGIQDLQQTICMLHAMDGYISYFPFYYGLGGGEKEHIYQHAWSEAMATIYMVKACREIYSEIGAKTSGQLFATGYSQGGHAAMATHKMLESGIFPEVPITASSPMSGAYDMTGKQAEVMFRPYIHPFYLPYLVLSYQYAYNLFQNDIYKAFKAPYNEQIKTLFKQPRMLDLVYVDSVLPKIPATILTDDLVAKFKSDSEFNFKTRLKENDLWNWKPKAPVQLCACYGDNEVMYDNTQKAYNTMRQLSPNVYKRSFGKHLSHNPCAPFALVYTKFFFDNIRSGKKKPQSMHGLGGLLKIAISVADKKEKHFEKKSGAILTDPMASRKK